MLLLLQAYSENSIEEMREQKEKGGMDNLEMFGILSTIQGYFGISRQGLVTSFGVLIRWWYII